MSREPGFVPLAGDGGYNHSGAVPVANIVLQNEHWTDTALLRPNHRPQVSIVNIAAADLLTAICFHGIHLLNIFGLIPQT